MAKHQLTLPFKRESTVPVPPEVGTTPSGTLPASILVGCGVRRFQMTADAARSVRAIVGVAAQAGISFDATGTYRDLDGQVRLFLSRYEPCTKEQHAEAKAKNQARMWDGAIAAGHPSKFWRKIVKNGKVPEDAASPGKSTHGIGVSIDWALAPAKPTDSPKNLDTAALQWLADNSVSFGMWNTNASENWHFSHFGPGVTPAVLAFEAGAGLEPLVAPGHRGVGTLRRVAGGGPDLTAVAGAIARVRKQILFLDNPKGNDTEAVQWLRVRLNVTMHLSGTGFQLDESSTVFDSDLRAFVVAFQEQVQRFVSGVSQGVDTFEVDGRVGPDTWFWLFA